MEARVVDLRYRMKDVLRSLGRNEAVRVSSHGRLQGILMPVTQGLKRKVSEHPYFGMDEKAQQSVSDVMEQLRRGRCRDL